MRFYSAKKANSLVPAIFSPLHGFLEKWEGLVLVHVFLFPGNRRDRNFLVTSAFVKKGSQWFFFFALALPSLSYDCWSACLLRLAGSHFRCNCCLWLALQHERNTKKTEEINQRYVRNPNTPHTRPKYEQSLAKYSQNCSQKRENRHFRPFQANPNLGYRVGA